jgi:hypothetical protein
MASFNLCECSGAGTPDRRLPGPSRDCTRERGGDIPSPSEKRVNRFPALDWPSKLDSVRPVHHGRHHQYFLSEISGMRPSRKSLSSSICGIVIGPSRTDNGDNHKRHFVLYARTEFTAVLQRRAASRPSICLHTGGSPANRARMHCGARNRLSAVLAVTPRNTRAERSAQRNDKCSASQAR